MRYLILALTLTIAACAMPRTAAIVGTDYSTQPARVAMRWECNGKPFTTQGTGVCEQKGPSAAKVSIKIPPLEGRVIYSNGTLKATEDFNWYPREGFWLWKKKPIKDTWAELELGEIASTYGDWPVALDVAAVHPDVGAIVTRGMLYHRICNDQDVPCSRLEVAFECAGHSKRTGPSEIGKCERMSGSSQPFRIQLKGAEYVATAGAKVYVSAPRLSLAGTYTPREEDFALGEMKLELPEIPNGPTLVGIRMAWMEAGKPKQVETRILVVGFAPEWTGLDEPHWMPKGERELEWIKPVLSDVLEANLYDGREMKKKAFTADKVISFPRPRGSEIACAFAWQKSSSDQVALCLNAALEEVAIP